MVCHTFFSALLKLGNMFFILDYIEHLPSVTFTLIATQTATTFTGSVVVFTRCCCMDHFPGTTSVTEIWLNPRFSKNTLFQAMTETASRTNS